MGTTQQLYKSFPHTVELGFHAWSKAEVFYSLGKFWIMIPFQTNAFYYKASVSTYFIRCREWLNIGFKNIGMRWEKVLENKMITRMKVSWGTDYKFLSINHCSVLKTVFVETFWVKLQIIDVQFQLPPAQLL